MPKRMSAVNLVVDELLPAEFRDPARIYDQKGMSDLLTEVAKSRPDVYPKLAKLLGDIGRKQAWRRGETFRMTDFLPVTDRKALYDALDAEEEALDAAGLEGKAKDDALLDLYARYSALLQKETNDAALAGRNNIAVTVLTGARGKEGQLRDLIASPGFYTDADGRPVPGFIRRSFAEGLRPSDFLAGTFGARSAVTDSKRATAQGGYLSKLLARSSQTYNVSEQDCGTSNGIDLPVDEPDLRGRVLQKAAGGLPAGTVLDRKALAKLKANSKDGAKVLVRSALSCGAEHGVCSKCYGLTAGGRFPKVGEHVGVTAATALGEPIAQGGLSMKHIVSGKGKGSEYSGTDVIMQFVESPEEFRNRTVVADSDGMIEAVEPAPQGGSYITLNGKRHYVPEGREIFVKPGQAVEAGDELTDGLKDPEDVMTYEGLGQARRYWADRLSEIAKASNAGMDRRNFEVLASAIVDHVELDDPVEEGFLPDDTVRYSRFLGRRTVPKQVLSSSPRQAVGSWLEQPALHYTVGTKITRKMADRLGEAGIDEVFHTEQEPGFRPKFVRLQQVPMTDDDWLASLGGSYLGTQLQQGITRAQDTNVEENIHPVPRLAVGVGYGEKLETTGKY